MTLLSFICVSAVVYKAFSLYRAIKEIKQPENIFQDLLETSTRNSDAKISPSFPLKNKTEILEELVKDKFLGLKECLTTLESLEQETPYFRLMKQRLLTEKFFTLDSDVVYDCLMPDTYAYIFLSVFFLTFFFLIRHIKKFERTKTK